MFEIRAGNLQFISSPSKPETAILSIHALSQRGLSSCTNEKSIHSVADGETLWMLGMRWVISGRLADKLFHGDEIIVLLTALNEQVFAVDEVVSGDGLVKGGNLLLV